MSIKNEKICVRTDMAIDDADKIGIEVDNEILKASTLNKVRINKELEEKTGKKEGVYITVETNVIKNNEHDRFEDLEEDISQILENILKDKGIKHDSKGMIVGLGNKDVTPDAVGPLCVSDVVITGHLFSLGHENSNDLSNLIGIIPGVMGMTGIETSDYVKSVVDSQKPDYLIVIDALATSSIDRLNKTIQITDAGINPGSGVGNNRKELSSQTLGIPVIAIGVPTVIEASGIVINTLEYLLKFLNYEYNSKGNKLVPGHMKKIDYSKEKNPDIDFSENILGQIGSLDFYDRRSLIQEVLLSGDNNLIVTPKEVDENIENISNILANSINLTLHEKMTSFTT